MTNQSIIELAAAKVPEAVILGQIRASKTRFDLSNAGIIQLSRGGVSASVIEAMRHPASAAPAVTAVEPVPSPVAAPRSLAPGAEPSAATSSLHDARERYDVPVVEVILPAVRRAVATTRNGRIGVIGTQATVASGAYQDAFAAARDTEITAVACPRFVDFVERGITSGRQVLGLGRGLPRAAPAR